MSGILIRSGAAGFAAALSLAMAATPVCGQEKNGDIPDLLGVWNSVTIECMSSAGKLDEVVVQFNITEQHDRLLRGTRSWANANENVVDAQGRLTSNATEELVGAIDFDNISVEFAEVDDSGKEHLRLTAPNEMEGIYLESGERANVCIQKLERRPQN